MLKWALLFAVAALVAALIGFTGIAAAVAGTAQILFFLFLMAAVVLLILHLIRRV